MQHSTAPIQVGVVGLGIAGRDIHLKAISQDPRFQVTAVADPDPVRQKEAATQWNCPSFANLEELLKACTAELIVVATPTHLHECDAQAVLQSGRHCLLEKPMALDYKGALALHQCAARQQRHLAINHVFLYRKDYFFLKSVLDSGLLGEIFEIHFNWSSYKRRNDWQTLRANGGGHLGNHGTHALSILLPLLGGRVTSLAASLRRIKDAGDAEDHANLFMKSTNGISSNMVVSTCYAIPGPRYAIYGSHGALISTGPNRVRLRYYDAKQVPPLLLETGPRRNTPPEQLPWVEEEREMEGTAPYRNIYDNLFHSLREQAPLLSSSKEALEVMRIIEWASTGEDPVAPLSTP